MFGTSSSSSSRTLRSDRARSISCSSNVLPRSSPRLGGFVKWRRRNSCIGKFRESEPPRRRRWMLHRSTVEYGTRRETTKVRGPRQVRAVQPEAAPSPPTRLHHRIASDKRPLSEVGPRAEGPSPGPARARRAECLFGNTTVATSLLAGAPARLGRPAASPIDTPRPSPARCRVSEADRGP